MLFRSSYELKDVYFAAGKADISKREARLFDKSEYVFDILGGKALSERDKMLDVLEKEENAKSGDDGSDKERLASLDKKWLDIENEVRDRLKKVVPILDEEDAAAVKKAALENKVALLFEIAARYEESVKQRIEDAAAAIDGMLKDMKKLQEAAKENAA